MGIVSFTVTPNGAAAYWLAVGDDDVTLTNGRGTINLAAGFHYLVWHFIGNPGSSISIVGTDARGGSLVEVKQSTVVSGQSSRAGYRGFKV